MTEPTALQHIMGYDRKTGEYHKAHMLVRLAQLAVMADRQITQADVARKMGRTAEAISRYFMGQYYMKPLNSQYHHESEANQMARIRSYEDQVERAIEELIVEKGRGIGLAMGTSTERYIDYEVVYPDLMRSG